MRRDLIIGILCSILIHAGLAGSGKLDFSFFKSKKKVVKEEAPTVQLMELPKLEPEPPEVVETESTASENTSIAPPSMVDVPGVVDLNSFVQQVQPPPPPAAGVAMTVPKTSGPITTRSMTEVFDLKNLDQQPTIRFSQQPVYPFEMKRQGISAEVLVEFICDANGEVRDARIARSDNHAFDQAALDAIYKWKFRAGKKGGRAVAARMQLPFVFSIAEE
ncbi:MAG: energy transducer TonB [Nibricoccus sp.]